MVDLGMPTQGVYEVPVTDVEVGESFNPRVLFEGIEELAKDIKRTGQITPIIVVRQEKKGKPPFFLVDGHRRHMAISSLAKDGKPTPTVKVLVKADVTDEKTAFLTNFTANVARNSYTSYEVAAALKKMQDKYGMQANEIRAMLNASKGFSKANINNLIACMDMHKTVVEAWANQHPSCTLRNLIKWKALTADEQLEAFQAMDPDPDSGTDEDTGEEHNPSKRVAAEKGEGQAEKGPAKPNRVPRGKIEDALKAAQKAKRNGEDGAEYVIAALKFVLGFKDSVTLRVGEQVFFDPRPADEGDGDEEEAA